MLDEIAPGWIIMKPTADAPDSLDELCRFRKPDDRLSMKAVIQWTHFQNPAETSALSRSNQGLLCRSDPPRLFE
jgi:hypothetical protein